MPLAEVEVVSRRECLAGRGWWEGGGAGGQMMLINKQRTMVESRRDRRVLGRRRVERVGGEWQGAVGVGDMDQDVGK
nr:hypothetical protein CFP56_16534 [Quercus suber]